MRLWREVDNLGFFVQKPHDILSQPGSPDSVPNFSLDRAAGSVLEPTSIWDNCSFCVGGDTLARKGIFASVRRFNEAILEQNTRGGYIDGIRIHWLLWIYYGKNIKASHSLRKSISKDVERSGYRGDLKDFGVFFVDGFNEFRTVLCSSNQCLLGR